MLSKYSFCIFRIPSEGGRVLWEITNTCNYCCEYCIFSSQNKKIKEELSTKEVIDGLYALKRNNFTHIKFTGGEPFVRNDMVDILNKATKLGFVVDISTNASLITYQKAQEIKKTNIKMVHVSLDGHNQYIHEFVRGKGTFSKTINGIKNLVNNDIYVRIGTVIYKENENYIEDTIKLAVSLGVNEIIFSFMEAAGRMKGDDRLLSFRSVQDLKNEIAAYAEKYVDSITVNFSATEDAHNCEDGICPGAKKFLYINNLGQLSPCTWMTETNKQYISELTLKNSTFEEIINSKPIESYLVYIEELRKNNIKGCPVRRR